MNLDTKQIAADARSGRLLKQLRHSLDSRACIGCARVIDPESPQASKPWHGIYVNHAYGTDILALPCRTATPASHLRAAGVLDVVQESADVGSSCVVLRNPWGQGDGVKTGTFTLPWKVHFVTRSSYSHGDNVLCVWHSQKFVTSFNRVYICLNTTACCTFEVASAGGLAP